MNPTVTAPSPDRLARFVVWSVWFVGFVGVLAFVWRFGVNVPFWDDWRYVPVFAGERGLSLGWLWQESNGHRFPVAKWLLWAGSRMTAGDLRAGMFLSALLLAGTAALMIRQAAALRGRTRLSDAFFPLLLLHWGHHDILLWSINLWFALFCAVMCLLIAQLARDLDDVAQPVKMRGLMLCALLLPIQAGPGLAASPAVALGLLVVASLVREPRRKRALRWTALGMFALVAVYFVALDDRGLTPTPPALGAQLRTSLQVGTTSMGLAGRALWPVSGLLLAAAVGGVGLLLLSAWRDPIRRVRAIALLSALTGMLAVTLLIAHGRSGFGWTAGFAARYVTANSPLLVGLYFACVVVGSPRVRRWGPALLCASLLGLAPINTRDGLAWAEEHAELLRAFERDLAVGVPVEELIATHGPSISPRQSHLLDAMEQMRRTGQGVFRD